MSPVIIAVLAAVTAAPLIGSTMAGAVSGRSTDAPAHVTLTAHTTLHRGPVTFEFSPTNPVTYFQINAIGVSCAIAKNVVVKGGKYHPATPAGWTYLGSGVQGTANCYIDWKHGSARVIAYRANDGAGC
jgi:hypothetical protein